MPLPGSSQQCFNACWMPTNWAAPAKAYDALNGKVQFNLFFPHSVLPSPSFLPLFWGQTEAVEWGKWVGPWLRVQQHCFSTLYKCNNMRAESQRTSGYLLEPRPFLSHYSNTSESTVSVLNCLSKPPETRLLNFTLSFHSSFFFFWWELFIFPYPLLINLQVAWVGKG